MSGTDFRNSHLPSQFGEVPKVARLGHHFTFSSGSGIRMRPNVRGTSKRGRPRGSRRGGPIGGKGRGMLLLHPPSIKNSVSTGHLSPSSSPSHSSTISNDSNPQYGEYPSVVFLLHQKKRREREKNKRPFNACVLRNPNKILSLVFFRKIFIDSKYFFFIFSFLHF